MTGHEDGLPHTSLPNRPSEKPSESGVDVHRRAAGAYASSRALTVAAVEARQRPPNHCLTLLNTT